MRIKYGINALGLICPEPLLKVRVALNAISIGECVEVLASDESSVKDLHRFVELTEHQILLCETLNHNDFNQGIELVYRFVLQKGR